MMPVETKPEETLLQYIRLIRPVFLLGGILLYALGLGIVHYLGTPIDWSLAILGQAWVSLLQLSAQLLNEYNNAPADYDNPNRTPFTGGSGVVGPGKLPRRTALALALATLAIVASISVLLIASRLDALVYLIMVIAFLGAFFYSMPPIRLEDSGYGELTTSVLVAFMVPAFAASLQMGQIHRLVAMSAFPLTALHMAMLIAFSLPDYANDLKHEKRTLLVRVGWQAGMQVHNALVAAAYLLLALAALFSYPQFVALPAMITLPLGVLQIWQMRRIAAGAKPNWTTLTLTAIVLFAAMAYLITFAFWTH